MPGNGFRGISGLSAAYIGGSHVVDQAVDNPVAAKAIDIMHEALAIVSSTGLQAGRQHKWETFSSQTNKREPDSCT
jgi:hypothetical protein